MTIARKIARIKNDVDPKSFERFVNELENAIQTVSTVLDSLDHLENFRDE